MEDRHNDRQFFWKAAAGKCAPSVGRILSIPEAYRCAKVRNKQHIGRKARQEALRIVRGIYLGNRRQPCRTNAIANQPSNSELFDGLFAGTPKRAFSLHKLWQHKAAATKPAWLQPVCAVNDRSSRNLSASDGYSRRILFDHSDAARSIPVPLYH